MATPRETLGVLLRSHREQKGLTQDDVAAACKTNRSAVAHLEQGLRLPKPEILRRICEHLQVPSRFWEPFTRPESAQRFEFEDVLSELVGRPGGNLDGHDPASVMAVEEQLSALFHTTGSDQQTLALFNSILLFYGVRPISRAFFERYLSPAAFSSIPAFDKRVADYQKEAIRLFSALREAYNRLNAAGERLPELLRPLDENPMGPYHARSDWNAIEDIEPARLPDLGYVSAARVRQEAAERSAVQKFLRELAAGIREKGPGPALDAISEKQRRRIDSLLRKFESKIIHGLFSPLFAPDPDVLEREADALGPKSEDELQRIATTQDRGLRNLARYLAADHMDVYVATSMRTDADYVSVDRFVKALFADDGVRPLKLRYFNPTQSWVEDRIAKGLVEALMLKRASITVYMAQKADTFGKDSEASVALGQGKPVIVYVPKLTLADGSIDTELLFRTSRTELARLAKEADPAVDIDDTIDDEALVGVILTTKLQRSADDDIIDAIARHWADFDLYGEAARVSDGVRAEYRHFLDEVTRGDVTPVPPAVRRDVVRVLVATAIRFESRAKIFREIHPLALQVILSTGVLNGILVVRSVEQCAKILSDLLRNALDLDLTKDEQNYRLVERTTGSTVRVISRHQLLRNAFERHYRTPLALHTARDGL